MILTATINEVKRRILFDNPQAVVAVKGDYEVNGVAFAFPAIYEDDFDLSTAVKTVYYKATDGIIYNHVVTDTDTDTGYPLWVFKDEINKGAFGDVEFALVCDKVEGGNIVKRWVSMITAFRVQRSIEIDESEQEENEQTYSERLADLMTQMANMQATVSGLASGAPTPESLVANMQEGRIYVYTGTETGYTAGHLYYYVNGTLTDGGQYGGTTVDATLTVSGAAADAKKTGDEISQIKEDLTTLLVDNPLTVSYAQGGVAISTGRDTTETNRCRTSAYVSFTGFVLKVTPKEGYKVSARIYTGASYSQYDGYTDWNTSEIELNDNTKYYKFVVARVDNADITPENLPDDVVTFSNIETDKTLTGDNKVADAKATGDAISDIKTITESALMSNTKALPFIWEQGTYNVNTGGKNAATNRVRTKYKVSLNSLNYIVMYCPNGWKLGGRRYTQNNEQTYLGTIPQFTGFKLIKHAEFTMYSFLVGKVDDTDITPSDIPDGIKIIPIYLPHWDANAHGNSVATFRTTRNNPLYVRQICDVAETYYEHRSDSTDGVADMQYGSDSATRIDTYTRQIDCSTFVTLCLLGIPYTETQYYTKTDTPASSLVPNPQYTWSIDPRLYDYYPDDLTGEPNGGARASQLAEWMIDMGWRVPKDKKLLNLEVGDILFYARTNETGSQIAQPDRFMCINHVAICTDKQINTSGAGLPYTYTLTEVTNVKPCVRKKVVEDGWDTPDVINVNNYNTLVLICRPDLGSI